MYIYICTVSLAFSGNIELCTALCRAGAVPTTLDRSGYDPIHYANENGHLVCVKLLESFSNQKQEGAPASLVNNASPPSSVTSSSEWTRCLDHTGSSFYHNRETGESLWGDDYRNANGHGDHSTTADNPPPKYNESNDVDSDENAVFVSSSNKKIEPSAADQDLVTKVIEETTLAPITEALVESSSNTERLNHLLNKNHLVMHHQMINCNSPRKIIIWNKLLKTLSKLQALKMIISPPRQLSLSVKLVPILSFQITLSPVHFKCLLTPIIMM